MVNCPPPTFKKPTVLGWFFFARSPQCWSGFGPRCEGRRRPGYPGFGSFSVLRCRPFSVSAKEDFAPAPALARVSGGLFVRKTVSVWRFQVLATISRSWPPNEERSRTPLHLVPRHMNSRLMVLCHRRSHVYGATRQPRPTPARRWTRSPTAPATPLRPLSSRPAMRSARSLPLPRTRE